MDRAARMTSIAYVVTVLFLTLGAPPWSPGLTDHDGGAAWFMVPPARDVVVNAAMLLPLGSFVFDGWPRIGSTRAIGTAAAASLAIEVLQATAFTHRWAQLSDVLLNTAGFALGFLWARWVAATTSDAY